MTAIEKKSKRKGIIGTILFHVLLLVAFLFMGLTYQDPPPAEEGISINFGFTDEGLGEIEPEDIEDIIDPADTRPMLSDWLDVAYKANERLVGPKSRGMRP